MPIREISTEFHVPRQQSTELGRLTGVGCNTSNKRSCSRQSQHKCLYVIPRFSSQILLLITSKDRNSSFETSHGASSCSRQTKRLNKSSLVWFYTMIHSHKRIARYGTLSFVWRLTCSFCNISNFSLVSLCFVRSPFN